MAFKIVFELCFPLKILFGLYFYFIFLISQGCYIHVFFEVSTCIVILVTSYML